MICTSVEEFWDSIEEFWDSIAIRCSVYFVVCMNIILASRKLRLGFVALGCWSGTDFSEVKSPDLLRASWVQHDLAVKTKKIYR